MENVDQIVLSTLKKLNCSFCETTDSLSDLVREDIIEGVVKLLWSIDEKYKKQFTDWKISPHAAKKFQTATAIADAINSLKIKEKIGYQSLLYPNVFDVRKIFINLIDKLPEEKVWIERDTNPFNALMTDVATSVTADLDALWVPHFCQRLRMVHDGHYWNEATDDPTVPFRAFRPPNADFRFKVCQVLKNRNEDFDSASLTFPFATGGDRSSIKKPPPLPRKPAIKPKPKPRAIVPVSEETTDVENNVSEMMEKITSLSTEIEEIKHEVMECQYAEARLEDDMIWMKEATDRIDPQLIELLEKNENALAVLLEEHSLATQGILDAQELFINAENDLDNEYINIKIAKGLTGNTQDTKGQIAIIKDVISKKQAAINETCRQIDILKKRVGEIVSNSERADYRKGIMDLMQNINGQYNEKIKIYEDNCALIEELEYLNGNLNRTYAAVEKWMTTGASSGKLQRAFRSLIAMHERCFTVRTLIKGCSTISREIEEIMDETEIQSQNAANIHLDEVMDDLAQIEQENCTLEFGT